MATGTSTMIATTALEASGEEHPMTWLTSMLRNWIDFACLGEYGIYVLCLFVLVILVYPVTCLVYVVACIANLALFIYKKKNNIEEGMFNKAWDKAKEAVADTVSLFAKIWHGIQLVLEIIGCGDRDRATCVELLKKGHLLGIAPGGLREQNFSDNNYSLVWGKRTGFAHVALEAKVPIIPMFTQNLREGYCTFGNTWLTRWLYERIRWLALPVYGGFPVKLRSYIGEPIPYDPNITAKELAEKTKTALENLINQHQKKPGNIMRALMERLDKHHKDD
ncbi:hypothetical protein lerEdw1_012585 [Lerista edwardsae]|nr:hypothetical protein lerEdw1_012585 [Lerista edwardsae]